MTHDNSTAGAVVDYAVLDDLRGIQQSSESPVLNEMIDMFLRNAPPRLEAIRAALAARDYTALSRTVHGLKGSCGLFGAQRMIAVCEKVQEAAYACDMQDDESGGDASRHRPELAALIGMLEGEFLLVQKELEKCR